MALALLQPVPPPYDALEWEKLPFPQKCKQVCQAWALQGYGSPSSALLFYGLKVALYVGGWVLFCGGPQAFATIGDWWLEPFAFQKAILWSMLFEGLGLACGSGPLTGRYYPPFGGFLYFLRRGTTKRPLIAGLPLFGGDTRTFFDVLLYLANQVLLVRALLLPCAGAADLLPIVGVTLLLGLTDKTTFLAARGEHYWTLLVVLVLAPTGRLDEAGPWLAGAKWVALALWFWAGVSKLNHHFPTVVCVMVSNSPVLRFEWLRRRMYRSYPDDLRPSKLAGWMAHAGTALELGVPLVLATSDSTAQTMIGLAMMFALHGFITSNVPMGVPIEWNFMVVYQGLFLFGGHPEVSLFSASAPTLAFLAVAVVAIPLFGNLFPRWLSFLLAMRYYAGNWAYSVWLFKGDSFKKLDARLKKPSKWHLDQLARFYDRRTAVGLVGKVIAFRAMHLQGRALQAVLPQAVDDVDQYEWVDGELIAGQVLGWNFGEGHLHDEKLLQSVQRQCGFEPGELRCIFVESQPLFRGTLGYRVADAASGPIASGELAVSDLRQWQPWPAG